MMKNFSYRVIHPKDTEAKVRRDALNKLIDEKISLTPELIERKAEIIQAKTREG